MKLSSQKLSAASPGHTESVTQPAVARGFGTGLAPIEHYDVAELALERAARENCTDMSL